MLSLLEGDVTHHAGRCDVALVQDGIGMDFDADHMTEAVKQADDIALHVERAVFAGLPPR